MSETLEERLARLDLFQERVTAAAEALGIVLEDPTLSKYEPQRAALREALFWLETDAACGDCIEGRCHWGGERSRTSIAMAEAGQEYVDPAYGACGCSVHEFSVHVRHRRARLKTADEQTEPAPPEACPSLLLHWGHLLTCDQQTPHADNPHGRSIDPDPIDKGSIRATWTDSEAVPSPWPTDREPPAGINKLTDEGRPGYTLVRHPRGWRWDGPNGGTPPGREGKWKLMADKALGDLVVQP